MAFTERLVLKSATNMSLHERFTSLRHIKTTPSSETRSKSMPAQQVKYYTPPTPAVSSRYHGLFEEDDDDVEIVEETRPFSFRRPALQSHQRPPMQRHLAFQAALRLKRKSIKQRLGPRPLIYHQQNLRYRNQNFRGRRNFTQYRGQWGGNFNRDNWHFRNQRQRRNNRGNSFRGRWRNNRGGGGRGGRGQQRNQPKMTREELDAQLDQYMSKTKTVLDHDLDEYMSQAQN